MIVYAMYMLLGERGLFVAKPWNFWTPQLDTFVEFFVIVIKKSHIGIG